VSTYTVDCSSMLSYCFFKRTTLYFPFILKMNPTFFIPETFYDDPTFCSATLAFLLPLEADALLPGGGFFLPGLLFMLINE
jgi:hypothetical protein